MLYEETVGDISPFLRLYGLSKSAGMNVQQVSRHNIVMLDTNLLEVSIAAIHCKKYHVRK